MSEQPVFTGTPDDWWDQAERIKHSESMERNLGDWYITRVKTAGDTKPNYRLSTPSKQPNMDKRLKYQASPFEAEDSRVRCIYRAEQIPEQWVTSTFVEADLDDDNNERVIWVRKKSGRWICLTDGRRNINDHTMARLNPKPARFTTEAGLI